MARLIRPTLGPVARTVAIAPMWGNRPSEILDSGATIARRTIQIPDAFENMGAMIVRHLAWRTFEGAGDGAATAAVLAQSLMERVVRYVAAGGDPVAVARGLDRGVEIALGRLTELTRRVDLPSQIAAVIAGTVRDDRLAEMIGQVVDTVGPDGAVMVEEAYGPQTEIEYIEGVRWSSGYVSPSLLERGQATQVVDHPRVLCCETSIDRPDQLVPLLESCLEHGVRSLFVVATDVKDPALSLLLLNRERGNFASLGVAKAPHYGPLRHEILTDLAVMTGGRCFSDETGDPLESATAADLGSARQAWASRLHFGLVGPNGDRAAIRERVRAAKGQLRALDRGEDHARGKLQERIGKLNGAAASILVGAPTESERAETKVRVEAAVTAARSAVEHGVVPGGGAALVACRGSLEAAAEGCARDEAFALRALAGALCEPMRAIAANAGHEARGIAERAARRGPTATYDVLAGRWVDAWESGIVDATYVTRLAVSTAVSAVRSAVTAEVLVHRRNVRVALRP